MMRLEELKRYGIPTRLIERWAKRQGDVLLSVQSRAVRKGLLGTPGASDSSPVRLLISAPTASGKSFCAEMAVARAIIQRRKALVLFPLKALAEQKYRVFQQTFGELGLNCIIATGDHPENDHAFARCDYDVAVAIYEKLDMLLAANLDALQSIGLIVVDEIQTITEPGRGAILERLLTAIRASVYESSLLGLSAVIGESESSAGRLAQWLGADLIEESTRPVDLLRGVAAEGSFRYRSFNSGTESDEALEPSDADTEPWQQLIERVGRESGSTLVFLKSRRETVEAAVQLAAQVGWGAADEASAAMADEEASYLTRALRQVLAHGVAFHNADLSSRQRQIVEQAFARGEVRVVFATTTLAMGVDLPADTVYLETVKYSGGVYDSRPSLVPVSRAEFDNMTGRAGRLGHADTKPGRAIVLANSAFERDILWENYIAPLETQPIRSVFDSLPVTDWVLHWAVSGLAQTTTQVAEIYSQTLAASANPDYAPPLEYAVEKLCEYELLDVDVEDTLVVTPLGRAAQLAGLTARQARYFSTKPCERFPESDFGWLALALGSPDWTLPAGILSGYEFADRAPLKMLYQRFDHLVGEARLLVGENLYAPDFSTLARLKAALILEQWRRMHPLQELEEQFQMHLGQIQALGETAAHLLSGMARVLEATDPASAPGGRLRQLAFGVRFGLSPQMAPIHSCTRTLLTRSDFSALFRADITTVPGLVEQPAEALGELLKVDCNSIKIKNLQASLKQEVYMQQANTTAARSVRHGTAPTLRPGSVEIDGTYERERYLVLIDGHPVRLTGKSFKYFLKLAWARRYRDTGWIFKEDIEIGFNQARYLYRMKNEINDGLVTPWVAVENNRLGYYRLNVEPEGIRINLDNLRDHPDFEVRSLARGEGRQAVN